MKEVLKIHFDSWNWNEQYKEKSFNSALGFSPLDQVQRDLFVEMFVLLMFKTYLTVNYFRYNSKKRDDSFLGRSTSILVKSNGHR